MWWLRRALGSGGRGRGIKLYKEDELGAYDGLEDERLELAQLRAFEPSHPRCAKRSH
jgi:hypothetical protein